METNSHLATTMPAKVLPNSDAVVEARNRLKSDLGVLVADARELLKDTATCSGESINAARVKLQATLESLKGRVTDAQGAAKVKAKETFEATDSYVRENPWKAVGVAAVVGLLFGVLLQKK